MSGVFRSRAFRALLFTVAVLVVALLGVQAWLGSGIGRGVVENRLSAALGRPVRLDGDFSLRLLPLPGVTGTGLNIFTRDGRWLVLDAGEYLARLSLWPLFRGEVEVVALGAEDARLDLAPLGDEPSAASSDPAAPYFAVPDIRSFELANLALHLDGMASEPFVQIEYLTMEDFVLDAPAPFETGLTLGSQGTEGAEAFTVFADGFVTLRSSGVVELGFSRLDARLSGWDVRGIEGDASVDLPGTTLGFGLRWEDPEQRVSLGAQVNWAPDDAKAVESYAIEEFELTLGTQRLAGHGCWLTASPPALNLDLHSERLDMRAFAVLADKWQVALAGPVGEGVVGSPAVSAEGEADAELPFAPAISMRVDEATYDDIIASGATLNVGPPPDCPAAR